MINSSAAFDTSVNANTRTFSARILLNGAEVECDIMKWSATKGACAGQTFSIGSVYSYTANIVVANLAATLENKDIVLEIGVKTGDNQFDYITYGTYTVIKARGTKYATELECVGFIASKLTGSYPARADTTLFSVIETLQEASGLTIHVDPALVNGEVFLLELANQTDAILTDQNDALIITENSNNWVTKAELAQNISGRPLREALGVAAFLLGGFAAEDNEGNIVIKKYSTAEPVLTVSPDRCLGPPVFSEDLFSLSGVKVVADPNYYTLTQDTTVIAGKTYYRQSDGIYIEVDTPEGNPEEQGWYEMIELAYTSGSPIRQVYESTYMSSGIFPHFVENILGYSFMPAVITMSLGDPRLEPWDCILADNVADPEEVYYLVPCHVLESTFDGGFASVITSIGESESEEEVKGPVAEEIERVSNSLPVIDRKATSALSLAADTNQYFWFVGKGLDTGAHITEVPRDVFLADPENGGGNLLARSNGVSIRNGLEELASFSTAGVALKDAGQEVAVFKKDGSVIGSKTGFQTKVSSSGFGLTHGSGAQADIYFGVWGSESSLFIENNSDDDPDIILRAGASAYTQCEIGMYNREADPEYTAIDVVASGLISLHTMHEEIYADSNGFWMRAYSANAARLQVGLAEDTPSIWLGVGSGGVNHGVYSASDNTWLVYLNGDSNAVIPRAGQNTVSSAANLNVTSGGLLRRYASSSRRYKKGITDINTESLNPQNLYGVRVVQFKYKKDYLAEDDIRYDTYIPGFIAEELEEAYPIAVDYENGQAEDWNARYIIPGMLKLIQEQNDRIAKLEASNERKITADL